MNQDSKKTDERLYLLALSMIPEIRADLIRRLLDHFGSPGAAWKADRKRLEAVQGLGPTTVEYLVSKRSSIDPVPVWEEMEKMGIRMLTPEDPDYPPGLKSIYDPPVTLFVKGGILPEDSMAISIVGSRRASNYGLMTSRWLAGELARAGLTVISGMARGVDSYAHLGALDAGGRTLAVMGCGLDKIYPPENRKLKERIEVSGASISEYPPGTPPMAWHFPARNRIISGLSLGVIITEAGEKSGALITADLALEQGKEVFAVPGNIRQKNHRGAHRLIKEGAKLIQGVEDVLEELGIPLVNASVDGKDGRPSMEPDEEKIFKCLDYDGVQLESIVETTGLPVSQVSAILMMLETRRLVQRMPGNTYVRAD
ncbi:MAG: DNA-processing protein DprA [Chloroflexi bacterium]|nr:DNA-processing protein DprA [Chloroflexota bacterium]